MGMSLILFIDFGVVGMEKFEYLYNYIASFDKNDSKKVCVLIDQSNSLKDSMINGGPTTDKYGDNYIVYRFSTYVMANPYEAFLDIIEKVFKARYSETMTAKDFVKASGVYPLHERILATYLSMGKAERDEKLIIAETDFERERMLESIIAMLSYISREERLFIVLNKIHLATLSALKVVNYIQEKVENPNYKIVLIANDTDCALGHVREEYNRVMVKAGESGSIFDCDIMEGSGNYEALASLIVEQFPLDKSLMPEYNRRLANMLSLLALEDMEYYIEYIYGRIQDENIRLKLNDAFNFYYYAAMCYILLGDENRATLMADRLSALYDKRREPEKDYKYNYVCHQQHTAVNQIEIASKYALSCIDIARSLDDGEILFEAVVLYYEAMFGGWQRVFMTSVDSKEADIDFVNNLRKYGYRNTLAHYLIFGFDNDDESIKKIGEGGRSESFEEAMELIHELKNTELELVALSKYIAFMNNNGFHKEAIELFNQQIEVIDAIDNPRSEANLYLGRGYNQILNEYYDDAESAFVNSINILYELRDAENVCAAIYNAIINRLCIMDYKSCELLVNYLADMLKHLNIRTIYLCDQSKIVAFKAIIYFMNGNEYKSYIEIKKLAKLIDIKDQDDDNWTVNEGRYLFSLINALHTKKKGNYREARRHFAKAVEYFGEISNIAFYSAPLLFTQYYKLLAELGEYSVADEIAQYAYDYCDKNSFSIMKEDIADFVHGELAKKRAEELQLTEFALKRLLGLARDVGRDKLIAKQRKDIWFLSSCQDLLNRNQSDAAVLVKDALNTIQDNFNFDRMFFANIVNGAMDEHSCNYDADLTKVDAVIEYFNKNRKEFLSNCIDKDFSVHQACLDLIGNGKSYTIVGIPIVAGSKLVAMFVGTLLDSSRENYIFNSDDLSIIKATVMQVHNTVERIFQNEALVKTNEQLNSLAITDQLTGIYNRQGMVGIIDDLDGFESDVAIMYMDLDNFKYYNDTFGHETGDMILNAFAKLLMHIIPDSAVAIRYGGDEFIIIAPGCDDDNAVAMAKAIKDGLENDIMAFVVKESGDAVIPDNKRLSTSIGIAMAENGKIESINEAIKNADTALYAIKLTSKADYALWKK